MICWTPTTMPNSFFDAFCEANADYYTRHPEENYRAQAEDTWNDLTDEQQAEFLS